MYKMQIKQRDEVHPQRSTWRVVNLTTGETIIDDEGYEVASNIEWRLNHPGMYPFCPETVDELDEVADAILAANR